MDMPFEVGEKVTADQLVGWDYKGLSGKPGAKGASRRFGKGHWILEVCAHVNPRARTHVMAIRTLAADATHWRETRERLMRHKK